LLEAGGYVEEEGFGVEGGEELQAGGKAGRRQPQGTEMAGRPPRLAGRLRRRSRARVG